MSHSTIKRVLSIALLIAFTAPSALALPAYDSSISKSSMVLSGDVHLTDNNDLITLSLRDSDVKQVLRMFADKAGLNIVFHSSVTGNVTLDLVNTPINEAFALLLQVAGLNFYKEANTLIVIAKSSPDNAIYSKQEMMVFPVNYVDASKIANFLNVNVFSMQKPGMSGSDAATVNSATNELIVFGMPSDVPIIEKVIAQFDREPVSKTFAVNHTTPAEMANMICKMLLPSRGSNDSSSESGMSSEGSSGSGAETGGAAGVVTGGAASTSSSSSSELKLGEGIVACSVTPSLSSETLTPFSVQNLSISYYPQRGTITLMGGSEAQVRMIENFIKENDIKQPQALLEVSIVELNEQGSKEFSNNWQIASRAWGVNFNGDSTTGGRPGGRQGYWVESTDYTWSGPGGSKDPYQDEEGNVIVPQQIARTFYELMPATTYVTWQINYLIENRKARVLANPKILITNGQESVIDLTQDYVEKVTSEYLTSSLTGTGSTGTAQRNYTIGSDLGIKVTLTPFISPEGYVTLNITPEYSTQAGEVRTQSEVQGQTDLAATLLSRRNLDLKNVRIKDGETLVIGGLIQESEQKTVHKIPILGDLPLIGTIFRSSSTSKAKSELVVMVTPKIINDDEPVSADTL